jgi:CheY-like chemotaxis protein
MDISSDTTSIEPTGHGASPYHSDSSPPVSIRELLDAIPLALAAIDGNLRCVGLNRRMAEKIGTAPDACLGRPVCEIVPPVAVELETRLLRVLAGDAVEEATLCVGSDDTASDRGETHSLSPIRSETGAIAGVLWTIRDADRPKVSGSEPVPGAVAARILMAEDLPMNQTIIADMLEFAGYEVLTVSDGAAAVNAVRREPIDLVLMDVEMPVMGGLEATRAIRALGAAGAVPIVAMTANHGPEQVAACRVAGMDAYIAKPIDRTFLLATVQKWLKSSSRPPLERRSEPGNVIDMGVLETIRARFGPVRTQHFLHEVHTQLEDVLGQLRGEADRKQLGDDLHALVSLAGHLGLRELSTKAHRLMVAVRRQADDIGTLTEEFRRSAEQALAALRPEHSPVRKAGPAARAMPGPTGSKRAPRRWA